MKYIFKDTGSWYTLQQVADRYCVSLSFAYDRLVRKKMSLKMFQIEVAKVRMRER